MIIPETVTACDLHASILAALQRREPCATAALILALDTIDPEAAQRIREAINETEAKYAARRGDPLWAEHVEARAGEWWT